MDDRITTPSLFHPKRYQTTRRPAEQSYSRNRICTMRALTLTTLKLTTSENSPRSPSLVALERALFSTTAPASGSVRSSKAHPTEGYDARRILKDREFEITPLKRGFPKTKRQYVMGFDTEADEGEPFLLQVGHPDEVILFDVTGETILETLLRHLDERCRDRKTTYTLFGFNMSYEYTQLFGSLPEASYEYSEILYDGGWYQLSVYNEKRFTFVIRLGDRTIRVLDAMAFIPSSLAGASEMIGVGSKYDKPPVFARSQRHEEEFIRYAEQDARLTQRLGDYVVDLHRDQDVPLSLSASHFAAQVYRRRYLRDSIPRPSEALEQLGLDCYHGGKNAFYRTEPTEWPRAFAYDIRSAYSEAMAQLPDVESGLWYDCSRLTPHSIVRAEVTYYGCHYQPLWRLQEHGRRTIAATGYELQSAQRCGCLDVHSVRGYELVGEPMGSLWRYVQDFYDMKRHATSGAEKTAAKLFLNGLYGKFFQKVPIGKAASFDLRTGEYTIHDYRNEYDFLAGGLYHPPIASLITGFVRAKIHLIEHKYRAVMTSTDGVFGTQRLDPEDVGDDLGQLDYSEGRLRVWRERTYIFEPFDGSARKSALHGFRGKEDILEQIPLRKGTFAYNATQMATLRMAKQLHVRPGTFVPKEFHVNL